MVLIKQKKCGKCGKNKNIKYFSRCKRGCYQSYCKECHNKYISKWSKDNNEKKLLYQKEYYYKNKEKINGRGKIYRENNKEKIAERGRIYREKNKEKISKRVNKWQKNNKERVMSLQKIYQNKKRKNDPQFKLRINVSNAINSRLRNRCSNKNNKATFSFLPYTPEELKEHLESQFEPWMSWENYGNKKGQWSIDHITPDSLFNYISVDDEEFKKCWSLDNLRPLNQIDNIKKGNKLETLST